MLNLIKFSPFSGHETFRPIWISRLCKVSPGRYYELCNLLLYTVQRFSFFNLFLLALPLSPIDVQRFRFIKLNTMSSVIFSYIQYNDLGLSSSLLGALQSSPIYSTTIQVYPVHYYELCNLLLCIYSTTLQVYPVHYSELCNLLLYTVQRFRFIQSVTTSSATFSYRCTTFQIYQVLLL